MPVQRFYNTQKDKIEIIRNDFNPNQFKIVRYLRGLTQKEMGEMLQVSASTICYLENGKLAPSKKLMFRLEMVFKFKRAWYFDWSDPPLDEKKVFFCKNTVDDPPKSKKKGGV